MEVSETLKKCKVAITSVGQIYGSTKSQQDYRTRTGTIYRGWGVPMDIGKTRENFDKEGKPWCFNYNVYEHMAKDYRKLKKKWDTRKCYKCNKIGHIIKDCRTGQKIKNHSIQEETDEEKDKKQEDFREGSE